MNPLIDHRRKPTAWGESSFRRLISTLVVADIALWMTFGALQWQTAARWQEPSVQGWVYFAQMCPLLVLPIVIGRQLDRRSGPPPLRQALTGLSAAQLLLAAQLLFLDGEFIAVLATAVLLGSMSALKATTFQAALGRSTHPAALGQAVAWYAVAQIGAQILGAALILPLLSRGLPGIACIVAAGIAVIAWSLSRPQLYTGDHRHTAAAVPGTLVRMKIATPLRALTHTALAGVLGLSVASMTPLIALEQLGGTERTYVALIVAAGIGALVGALLRKTTSERGLALALLLVGLATVSLGIATASHWAIVANFILSSAGMLLITSSNLTIHQGAASANRSRHLGAFIMAWGGSLPIGALALGWLATGVGVGRAVTIFGTVQCVIALASLAHSTWGARRRHG